MTANTLTIDEIRGVDKVIVKIRKLGDLDALAYRLDMYDDLKIKLAIALLDSMPAIQYLRVFEGRCRSCFNRVPCQFHALPKKKLENLLGKDEFERQREYWESEE